VPRFREQPELRPAADGPRQPPEARGLVNSKKNLPLLRADEAVRHDT
jgi:hypothetical protein